jgi:hypothetical protein
VEECSSITLSRPDKIISMTDEYLMGTNGKPDLTICGYCTQGRHSECREDTCNCAKSNHELV